MAVFGGVWYRNREQGRTTIAHLLASLDAPYHTVFSAYDEDGLILAAKSLKTPAVVSHCGVVAALTGRLNGDVQASHVLDEYIDEKYGGLDSLSGDYALAVFDAARGTLVLMRDAIGTHPLYYYESDELFAFGSRATIVLAAAGVRARPNHGALTELLVGRGALPRGETCFAGVHAVMPGHALIVTRDTVSGIRHNELRPIVPTPLRSFEQSASAFRRSLLQSIERRVAPDGVTAVVLDGGVSSEALLCAAAAVTDPQRVLAISEALPATISGDFEADARATENPMCYRIPGTLGRTAAAARMQGAKRLMIGQWGDAVLFPFPPPYMLQLIQRGHFKQFMDFARTLPKWLDHMTPSEVRSVLIGQFVRGVMPPRILSRFRAAANPMASHFDKLQAQPATARRELTSHSAAVRRAVCAEASVDAMESLTKCGWSQGVETQFPYLDADLVQLLLAIPPDHALNEGMPKALLRRGLSGIVGDEVLQRKDDAGTLKQRDAAVTSFAMQHRECVEGLEQGRRFVQHGLMSESCAARTIAKLNGSGEVASTLLPTLVGLNAWLKVFFDDSAAHDEVGGFAGVDGR